jgi:hypothetical protein
LALSFYLPTISFQKERKANELLENHLGFMPRLIRSCDFLNLSECMSDILKSCLVESFCYFLLPKSGKKSSYQEEMKKRD